MKQIGEDYKTQDIKRTNMGDVTNHGIGSQFDPSTAKKSKDGFWRDVNNNLPKVSASDIERHTYCPLSWELAKILGRVMQLILAKQSMRKYMKEYLSLK